jgi:pyruvate/2-oxoglutarate dehydrogenase complex dihydrolipoamide dehydrogenase (E3) component
VARIATKALIGSARALLTARHAKALGIDIEGPVSASIEGLRHHKEGVVEGMSTPIAGCSPESGMDFITGCGQVLRRPDHRDPPPRWWHPLDPSRDVVVSAGSTPALPQIDGVAQARVWDSGSILHLEKLPESLIALGGG